MRDFYVHDELDYANRLHTIGGFLRETLLLKPLRATLFFCGIMFLPVLFMIPRVLLDKRMRFLCICVGIVFCGVMLETWFIPHYFATITVAIYAIGLQAMRHLRRWKPGGQPVGAAILQLMIMAAVALGVIRLYAEPLHLTLAKWPGSAWASMWSGPGEFGAERAAIKTELENMPGNHLVIVRYSEDHNPFDEWIYNDPDIDDSKVIWAREMDAAANTELFSYYRERDVWLVQPDVHPTPLLAYPQK